MATGNANPLRVTGLKIGNAEWMIDGAEGKSIREICDHFKIKRDGHNFFVNGVPAARAGDTIIESGTPGACQPVHSILSGSLNVFIGN